MNLKKCRAGFTLVEIIIVIVIVAILVAIAVPTMLGFVEKANEQQYIAEARTALVSAQAVALEKYVKAVDKNNVEPPTRAEILSYIGDSALTDDVGVIINVMLQNEEISSSPNLAKVFSISYTRNKYTVAINAETKEVTVHKNKL